MFDRSRAISGSDIGDRSKVAGVHRQILAVKLIVVTRRPGSNLETAAELGTRPGVACRIMEAQVSLDWRPRMEDPSVS